MGQRVSYLGPPELSRKGYIWMGQPGSLSSGVDGSVLFSDMMSLKWMPQQSKT